MSVRLAIVLIAFLAGLPFRIAYEVLTSPRKLFVVTLTVLVWISDDFAKLVLDMVTLSRADQFALLVLDMVTLARDSLMSVWDTSEVWYVRQSLWWSAVAATSWLLKDGCEAAFEFCWSRRSTVLDTVFDCCRRKSGSERLARSLCRSGLRAVQWYTLDGGAEVRLLCEGYTVEPGPGFSTMRRVRGSECCEQIRKNRGGFSSTSSQRLHHHDGQHHCKCAATPAPAA